MRRRELYAALTKPRAFPLVEIELKNGTHVIGAPDEVLHEPEFDRFAVQIHGIWHTFGEIKRIRLFKRYSWRLLEKKKVPEIRFHTASFSETKNHFGVTFSIARSQPRGNKRRFSELPELKPDINLLIDYKRGIVSVSEYRRRYREETLRAVDCAAFVKRVIAAVDRRGAETIPRDATLLCWEKRGEFCHRQIVADWLSRCGYVVGARR